MSDSQARAAYEYRTFLLEVSEGLTQNDCQKIVFLEQLPTDLEHKPSLNVLMLLEMRGKLSASRPDDLAKLLKRISRHDLAKKVREFIKQQRKGRALSPLQRLDHPAVKLSASLEVTLLQCKILLEQVENLKEEAEEMCYKRVEEVVADAQAIISEQVQRKFMYASKLIAQEAESREQTTCIDRDRRGSTPPSPDSPLSSLEFEPSPTPSFQPQSVGGVRLPTVSHTNMHTNELKAAVESHLNKSQSLPRSGIATGSPVAKQRQNPKQPLVPPASQRRVKDDTAPSSPGRKVAGSSTSMVAASSASPTASTLAGARQVIPGAEQAVLGTTQLVTGRLAPKPTPPPKPKFKKVASQQVEDNDYEDLATSTYTGGDSGFAESTDFLKVSLPGQHQEPPNPDSYQAPYSSGQPAARGNSDGGYAPLNMEAVHAGYYKSLHREGVQEVQYAPQVTPQAHQYMNFSQSRK